MANTPRSGGLQVVFSIFLGLMVTAFVGVGVYTFHPPPHRELTLQIQNLNRREQAIRDSRPPGDLTTAERTQIQELNVKRNELTDTIRVMQEGWGRITSIILIALATIVMAVSLVRSDQLPVISNGLLMGGVFTMIYGVGWIIATDTSVTRFVVMTVALVITLALGYRRFVRGRALAAVPSGPAAVEGTDFADIEQRVRDLEERINEAANALGHKSSHSL